MIAILKRKFVQFITLDYKMVLVMIAMPLILTWIFGMSFTSDYKPIAAVCNYDKGELGSTFIELLNNEQAFLLKEYSYAEAEKLIEQDKAIAAVIIPEDFSKNINNGSKNSIEIMKAKDVVEIYNLSQTINNIYNGISKAYSSSVSIYQAFLQNNINISYDNIYKHVKNAYAYIDENPVLSTKIASKNKDDDYDTLMHYVIGFLLFFSTFSIVFTAGDIIEERNILTWQRQIVSPLPMSSMIGGNLIFAFLLGTMQVWLLLLTGRYLFGIKWGNSIFILMLVSSLFVLVICCLGLFLSGILKTTSQLSAAAPVILVSLAMLGGCMWPLEIISFKPMLILADITPHRWALKAMEGITIYNKNTSYALIPCFVLLIMALFWFSLGIILNLKKSAH